MRVWELDTKLCRLDEVLHFCIEEHGANRLLVAVRMQWDPKTRMWYPALTEGRLDNLFGNRTIRKMQACAWPGTVLTNHPGLVVVANLDHGLARSLSIIEPLLGRWLHSHEPSLPEDVCAFKGGDAFPVLMSVTHEKDAWLVTDRMSERKKVGGAQLSKTYIDSSSLSSYVFDGPNFCRLWRKGATGRSPMSRR